MDSNSFSYESSPAKLKMAMRLSSVGIVFTFIVILVGVWTRLVDAGLGCPDWPGCYGALVVPNAERASDFAPHIPLDPFKAWVEMVHRYLASSLGLLAIVLVVIAWKNRHLRGYPVAVSVLLLLVICIQGAFGALTVTLKLWPQVVTLHLLGGFTVLAIFFWLRCRLGACQHQQFTRSSLPRVWWAAILILTLQVALGGWTSSNYAGIACTGFPTCNNEWWPSYMDFNEGFHITQEVGPNYLYGQLHAGARTAIHYTHRIGALGVGIALLMLWSYGRTKQPSIRGITQLMLGIYALQITLGIVLVLFSLPLSVALMHTAGAALLLLCLLRTGWRLAITQVSYSPVSYRKVSHA